jgi:integrase
VRDTDRHGNVRLYYRPAGEAKVRIREAPGTAAFADEVAAARLGLPYPLVPMTPAIVPATTIPGGNDTFGGLLRQYRERGGGSVSATLFRRRCRQLEEVAAWTRNGSAFGQIPLAQIDRKAIARARDALKATPGARDDVVRIISALYHWANGVGEYTGINPCAGIKKVSKDSGGFHTWTIAEIEQFEARWPLGTIPHLMLGLALFTGLRRQELAVVGPPHETANGWLKITPGKTAHSTGVEVNIPILPRLRTIIDASPIGKTAYVESNKGRGYTTESLGNYFREWADEAGLPQCSLHGLRKAGSTLAAESGATAHQLMAIYGWTTLQQAEKYTRAAERKRLAAAGIGHLDFRALGEETGNKIVPLLKAAR